MNKSKQKDKINYWQPQLNLFIKLSAWIAFPVIIGTLIGYWLDNKYETQPWLLIISVGLSFFISMFGLITNTIKEFKKINQINENNKNSDKNLEN